MTLALETVYVSVIAQFDHDGTAADHVFGWRKKEEHVTRPRVVWEPGDLGSAVGLSGLPLSTGNASSPVLGTLRQACKLYITAPADNQDPNNELSQWRNTMTLRNLVFRALVLNVPRGSWRVETEQYVTDIIARRANVTIAMVISVSDDILDDSSGLEELHPWSAAVDLHELDDTEEFPVPSP